MFEKHAISIPFKNAQTIVPTPIPTIALNRTKLSTTAIKRLPQSYIILNVDSLICSLLETSFTNISYTSGGRYVWNKSAIAAAQMITPATYATTFIIMPFSGRIETKEIAPSSANPYNTAVKKDKKYATLTLRSKSIITNRIVACNTYSAIPKLKNGKIVETFKCNIYAGATTIEIPNPPNSVSAVPSASISNPTT